MSKCFNRTEQRSDACLTFWASVTRQPFRDEFRSHFCAFKLIFYCLYFYFGAAFIYYLYIISPGAPTSSHSPKTYKLKG